MTDHIDNIQRWASDGGGEGDPVAPSYDIRSQIDNDLSQLGNLTYYEGDIPETATGRANGIFQDYDDLYQYLEAGGLVFINPDTGQPTPNPIVHIYANVDDEDGGIEYEVWIDENS